MRLQLLIIALLSVLMGEYAWAGGDDEFREKTALFVLGDLRQWVGLQNLLSEQKSTGSPGSVSNEFQETYNASFDANIINPHVLATNLTVSLGMDQNFYNGSGSSGNGRSVLYNYQFTGNGLDRSVTPFNISSYRNTEVIMSAYSPTYTATSTGTDFDINLRNQFLPSAFHFSRIGIDNTGGGTNNSNTATTFNYSANNSYNNFSNTGLSVSLSNASGFSSGGGEQTARSYAVSLNNTLQWGPEGKYSLSTNGQVNDMIDLGLAQRNISLSEGFQDRLGKALDLSIVYSYVQNDILSNNLPPSLLGNGPGNTQLSSNSLYNTKNQAGEVSLTHRLFESLTTKVKGKGSYNDVLGGTEYRYSEEADLLYTKKLPDNNRLSITAIGVHETVSNLFGSPYQLIQDESHVAQIQTDIISLLTSPIQSVTLVRDSQNRSIIYKEGDDYTVDLNFGTVTVKPGGLLAQAIAAKGPQAILISYTVAVDANVKYNDNTVTVSGNMTLGGGKYTIGGSYTDQWMTLLSGQEQNLRNSSMKMLYFTGHEDTTFNYRVSYTDSQVGELKSQIYEGTGTYAVQTDRGMYTFVLTDRYCDFGATPTLRAYAENIASASVVGVHGLFSNGRLTVSANLYDERSEIRYPQDIASLRLSTMFVLNKFTLNIDGQTSWSFSSGTVTRNNTLMTNLMRYF